MSVQDPEKHHGGYKKKRADDHHEEIQDVPENKAGEPPWNTGLKPSLLFGHPEGTWQGRVCTSEPVWLPDTVSPGSLQSPMREGAGSYPCALPIGLGVGVWEGAS